MIQDVAKERLCSAWNPLDKKGNQGNTEILNRILGNTLEQFVVFSTMTLILSTYLQPGHMKIIPIFVIEWALARLVFQSGYLINPIYRTPGMAANFALTMWPLFGIVYHQCHQGPFLLTACLAPLAAKLFYGVVTVFA